MRMNIRIAAAALMLVSVPVSAQPGPPNVVILLADDWGFSDVGAFGGEIRTPHLDALARAGVRFTNFHVAGSCSPTRAMLQTGISNHRAGLGNMPETIPPAHVGKTGYDQVLSFNAVTLATLFRDAGYLTVLTGKWHLGKTPDRLPTARGYDHAFSMSDAGADNFEQRPIEGMYEKADWTEDGKPARLPGNYYSSTFIVDRTIAYADQARAAGKPFFASVNFLANHTPVQAPDSDIARYASRYARGWSDLRDERATRVSAMELLSGAARPMPPELDWARRNADERAMRARAMAAYAGMAEAMDREVGRLIAHLKANGAYENTIFLFLSDNGAEALDPMASFTSRMNIRYYYDTGIDAVGRRNSFTAVGPGWALASVSPLAGYKFTAFEGGLRVPLILSWPGNPSVRQGSVARAFTHVTDIAPTLLDLAGVPGHSGRYRGQSVEPMLGKSLVPLLEGAAATVRTPEEPLGYELSGNAALFKGDYKLVKNLPPAGTGAWQLFDMVRDPGETNDLARAMPERTRAMIADYDAFAARDKVLPMPEGYTAAEQITDNAFRNILLPRIRRALPWAAAALVLLVGGAIVWRRNRRRV
jgi:arylsulfatase A-like enzyme